MGEMALSLVLISTLTTAFLYQLEAFQRAMSTSWYKWITVVQPGSDRYSGVRFQHHSQAGYSCFWRYCRGGLVVSHATKTALTCLDTGFLRWVVGRSLCRSDLFWCIWWYGEFKACSTLCMRVTVIRVCFQRSSMKMWKWAQMEKAIQLLLLMMFRVQLKSEWGIRRSLLRYTHTHTHSELTSRDVGIFPSL